MLLLALAVGITPLFARIEQHAYVKASNAEASDSFGAAVAISGDTMVIGAPWESGGGPGVNGDQASNSLPASGAVYVFVREAGVWTQRAYLKASDPTAGSRFGSSVAIEGDRIAVGSFAYPGGGAVYVFSRQGATWRQEARVVAPNRENLDNFGASIALSGTTLLIGAHHEDSASGGINGNQANNGAASAGAAYVFEREIITFNGLPVAVWSLQAYLKATHPEVEDQFGWSVALDGDTAVVGAINEDGSATGVNGNANDNSLVNPGAAYVFERSGGVWSQRAYLKAASPRQGEQMGASVAISGSTIVCSGLHTERVTLFTREGIAWSVGGEVSIAPSSGDRWLKLALDGDTLLVADRQAADSLAGVRVAPATGDHGAPASGGVHLFRRHQGLWTRHVYLKASNPGANDRFGEAVALSGGTAVIGADGEDSYATGIDGNQFDNTAQQSGAAYVFSVEGPFVEITSASRSGNSFITEFAGPPGLTGWKVMGSTDLANFTIDKTPATTLVEFAAGKYRAVTDLTGAGPDFFLRIEHE